MIKSLNIDEKFTPTSYLAIKFTMMQFSGGEMHIKLDTNEDYSGVDKVIITNRFRDGNDLMKVLFAKDALERKGVKRFELVMPYIPYARQDRVCVNGEAFTLKVFTNLINSTKFEKVYVLDAHSDVAPALIDNCANLSIEEYVKFAYYSQTDGEVILISPDSGANKKSTKLFDNTKIFNRVVKCDKRRNLGSGELDSFEVFGENLKDRTCMIVDDICDGGRTFIGIAQELKKKEAGDIYLFVTHGIFSYGMDELKKHFKKIFTTNSFKDVNDDLIMQFKIKI
jgi:ribose-phosphate pyrophosphokinase